MKKKIAIIGTVLGSFACLSGGWFYGAYFIQSKIECFVKKHEAYHQHFSYDSLKIKGFPFFYTIKFSNPKFEGPIKNLGLPLGGDLRGLWQGESLSLNVKIWNFRHLKGFFQGHHKLILTRADQPGVLIKFQEVKVSGALNHHHQISEILFEIPKLLVKTPHHPHFSEGQNVSFEIRKGAQISETLEQPIWILKLDMGPTILPFIQPGPLGQTVQKFTLDTTVVNPVMKGPLLPALKNWRDEGGTLEIRTLYLEWGGLRAGLSGTVALDSSLRPLGSMTAKIYDFEDALKALVKAGFMKKQEALAGKIALSMLMTPDSEDQSSVSLSVTAQEGKISVGPLMFSPLLSLEQLLRVTPEKEHTENSQDPKKTFKTKKKKVFSHALEVPLELYRTLRKKS